MLLEWMVSSMVLRHHRLGYFQRDWWRHHHHKHWRQMGMEMGSGHQRWLSMRGLVLLAYVPGQSRSRRWSVVLFFFSLFLRGNWGCFYLNRCETVDLTYFFPLYLGCARTGEGCYSTCATTANAARRLIFFSLFALRVLPWSFLLFNPSMSWYPPFHGQRVCFLHNDNIWACRVLRFLWNFVILMMSSIANNNMLGASSAKVFFF